MSRSRWYLELPTEKVERAGELLRAHGIPLTAYLGAELTYAARRCSVGDTRGVPAAPPRRRSPAGSRPLAQVSLPGTPARAARIREALKAAGSTPAVVAEAALDALIAADGEWLDAAGPGLPPVAGGPRRVA